MYIYIHTHMPVTAPHYTPVAASCCMPVTKPELEPTPIAEPESTCVTEPEPLPTAEPECFCQSYCPDPCLIFYQTFCLTTCLKYCKLSTVWDQRWQRLVYDPNSGQRFGKVVAGHNTLPPFFPGSLPTFSAFRLLSPR